MAKKAEANPLGIMEHTIGGEAASEWAANAPLIFEQLQAHSAGKRS